jgi:hypothetical protein
MSLRVDSFFDTEKRLCFQNSATENLFPNWCDLHTDKFIDSNKIAEFVTHIHLAERIMAEF